MLDVLRDRIPEKRDVPGDANVRYAKDWIYVDSSLVKEDLDQEELKWERQKTITPSPQPEENLIPC